jgi:hypothetical protein
MMMFRLGRGMGFLSRLALRLGCVRRRGGGGRTLRLLCDRRILRRGGRGALGLRHR